MRVAVSLIVTCFIASCARPDYVEWWAHRFVLSAGPQLGYGIKRVVEKQRPITLLGDDGSACRTSAQRFAGTAVGAWVACDWKLPGLDSTEIAAISH